MHPWDQRRSRLRERDSSVKIWADALVRPAVDTDHIDGSDNNVRPTFLFLAFFSLLHRNHELQSRPDIGDGAHFDVDQTGAQAGFANDVLGKVGGYSGAF